MDLIKDFIEEELLGGKIVFDQSQGGYSFEEDEDGILIRTNALSTYERYFQEHPNESVSGTCRIIAGAVVGKLRSRGWIGKVDYHFSYAHVVPILTDGSRRVLVDLGRRLPIAVPVEVDGKVATSDVYGIPYTYQAKTHLSDVRLDISGVGFREECLTSVVENEEEERRILESIRHNSLLLRSAWVDGKFVQSSTNNTNLGLRRLDIRNKLLNGAKVQVLIHD